MKLRLETLEVNGFCCCRCCCCRCCCCCLVVVVVGDLTERRTAMIKVHLISSISGQKEDGVILKANKDISFKISNAWFFLSAVSLFICLSLCISVRVCMPLCVYIYVCVCVRATRACVRACVCACMCVRACLCVCVCARALLFRCLNLIPTSATHLGFYLRALFQF